MSIRRNNLIALADKNCIPPEELLLGAEEQDFAVHTNTFCYFVGGQFKSADKMTELVLVTINA